MKKVSKWQYTMPKRLLSEREVILGNDQFDYCDRMNMHTSPGYPYVLDHMPRGKEYLFDLDAGSVRDPRLESRYEEREKKAKLGEVIDCSIWIDCLKDERRPIEKIRMGKTRLFTIPPVDFTMLMRKYFLSFACCFYENHCKDFSAVGCDPYSADWMRIYYHLSSMSKQVIAGDFGTFDGNMHKQLILAFCDIVNFWYDDGDENARVRQVLMEEVAETTQLCMNSLYRTKKGNPSGNPLTVVLNTFVNVMYMALSWIHIMSSYDAGMANMESFWANVRIIAYGDDNVMAVRDDVVKVFTQSRITEYLLHHGVEYTDETKTGTSEIRKLDDVTFLKCGFFVEPEDMMLVKARMSKVTIQELINWIRRSDNDVEMLMNNIDDALKFAYFWGEEYFNDLLKKVNRGLREVGIRPVVDFYRAHDIGFKMRMGKLGC